MAKKIRVLIVDDSALMRGLLAKCLTEDSDLEVVGQAADPYQARDLIVQLRPDVITLDVEMPKMDGVTFLRKLMAKLPIPTVMLSSLTEKGARITLEAMEAGAVEVLTKPSNLVDGVPEMKRQIQSVVKRAAASTPRVRTPNRQPKKLVNALVENSTDKVVAMGASTGGVEALARILPMFPKGSPGMVVVVHMPGAYTGPFAQRLSRSCAMEVREASDKDRIRTGVIFIAPGGRHHAAVCRFGGQYRVEFVAPKPGDPFVPGVDQLFLSTAKAAGKNAVGVVLTGMGQDGALGMKAMRAAGARCFAQDERSCVVFGMPKAALELGGAEAAVALDDIPDRVLGAFGREQSA